MSRVKFVVSFLLIIATILTFSLPVVAHGLREAVQDTTKNEDSLYLSEETLKNIGCFDKIEVNEDTKYLIVYFGFVSVMHLYNKTFDEFIDILDGVRINEDEPLEGIQAWEWGMIEKFFIATAPDGSFQLKRFFADDDGSMHEDGILDSTRHPYDLYGNIDSEKLNEYIPEKVLNASLDDRIIKCIDEEIKVEGVYIIESPKPDYLYGWSVCFKTDKGDYIYFYHESMKDGDYLFPVDEFNIMLEYSMSCETYEYELQHIGDGTKINFSAVWPAEIIDRYDVNSENFFAKTGWKNDFSWVKADEPVNDDPIKTDDVVPTETGVENVDNDQEVLASNPGADVIDDHKIDVGKTQIVPIVIVSFLVLAIVGSVVVVFIRKKKANIR